MQKSKIELFNEVEAYMLANKETIERNIELTFDFVNYLIENKEEMNKLPDNFELVFVENDFSKADSKQAPTAGPNLQNKYVILD